MMEYSSQKNESTEPTVGKGWRILKKKLRDETQNNAVNVFSTVVQAARAQGTQYSLHSSTHVTLTCYSSL